MFGKILFCLHCHYWVLSFLLFFSFVLTKKIQGSEDSDCLDSTHCWPETLGFRLFEKMKSLLRDLWGVLGSCSVKCIYQELCLSDLANPAMVCQVKFEFWVNK